MAIARSGLRHWLFAKPAVDASPSGRIKAIDLARGVAVALMILNHGVKGLLDFDRFPDWGLVPVHMVTRFASSLFIIVFGVALAVAFLPKVHTTSWPRRRLKLLLTGVVIFFWYKVLTVAEMLHPYAPEQVLATLLYQNFPSFVEVLGFYAIALLWVPFFLPLWARMPFALRLASPLLVAALSWWLLNNFHFWGWEPLQAILVEHEDYYTWGQLARAPLVLLGLLLGELVLRCYHRPAMRRRLALGLALASALLFAAFAAFAEDLQQEFVAIAYNAGKHPPELLFMLFSLGGALGILAVALFGGEALASALRPITVIGSDALQAFIFHIVVIFVIFRYLLGYWHDISYPQALILTLCLIFATSIWISLVHWVQAHR